MSSWKKASKSNQKTHRERHQPEARKHLGLLEKKTDYKSRARNASNKEKTLQLLHRRALTKNPDEFYHHMINSRLKDDKHEELEKDDEHTADQLALMQTQDLKYIIMKRTVERKKIDRLRSELHLIDEVDNVQRTHIYFEKPNQSGKELDLATRVAQAEKPKINEVVSKKAEDLKKQSYQELQKRIQREKELGIVQQKLQIKRALQQKRLLKPKKIRKATKDAAPIFKFHYERKK